MTLRADLPGAVRPVPTVRLFAERVLVARTEGLRTEHDEVLLPLLALGFDYGGTRVGAGESRRVMHAGAGGLAVLERDAAAESEARRVLERMGAVEADCLEDVVLPHDCAADYVVHPGGDRHAFCAFTTDALPRLAALGWRVDVAPDYPFRVAPHDAKWFAAVAPDEERPDWFGLQLGIEVDGRRIDMLPAVVELLRDAGEEDDLRAVEKRVRSSFALKVSDAMHVSVMPEQLRALLRVVIELYLGVRGRGINPIRFPEARAGAIVRAEQALSAAGIPLRLGDPTGVVERARARLQRPPPAPPPPMLRATLRPYQEEGVAFLAHLREQGVGGVLADDMGLGKTLQTIAHLCAEKDAGRLALPALVVAPTSLAFNWEREIARFAPHLRATVLRGPDRHRRFDAALRGDVVITTYPVLVRDEERFAEAQFSTLVLDEAQTLKNHRTQAYQAIRAVRAEHCVCLTGTPVENHLGELWALFDLLAPGLLGDEVRFRAWYRQPIEVRGDGERLAALRDQVAPYVLRRVKRDVAKDLPPKTELYRPVEMTGRQRELYEHIRVAAHADVRQVIRKKGLAASTLPILDALTKLRQVCCDPRLLPLDAARGVTESAKMQSLFELLESDLPGGHRVLIFSQFTSMLALIARGLEARKTKYLVLTGATQNRQRVVDAFERGEADVFLISLKAGGTGLNLVSADTVVHFDPWWNPSAQAQATDRAYRIGQTKPVFVHALYASGSVEERVLALQEKKRWLQATLLGDDPQPKGFGLGDVEALFAPLEE